MSSAKKQKVELVHIEKGTPFTDSLVVAREFGIRHDNVLAKIRLGFDSLDDEITRFSFLNFKERDYKKRGKIEPKYEITEDGFLELGMSFTGDKARKVRIRFISEFRKVINELNRIKSEPNRKETLQYKRDSAKPMTDCLVYIRELAGKETKGMPHCSNEHLFCNRALTGEYKPLDEDALDVYDLRLLNKIRERNTVLIALHPVQKDRKKIMDDFVMQYREKHPRLTLVKHGAAPC